MSQYVSVKPIYVLGQGIHYCGTVMRMLPIDFSQPFWVNHRPPIYKLSASGISHILTTA